jgi:hypothetical protein
MFIVTHPSDSKNDLILIVDSQCLLHFEGIKEDCVCVNTGKCSMNFFLAAGIFTSLSSLKLWQPNHFTNLVLFCFLCFFFFQWTPLLSRSKQVRIVLGIDTVEADVWSEVRLKFVGRTSRTLNLTCLDRFPDVVDLIMSELNATLNFMILRIICGLPDASA